jgi:hypothetical protein
MLRAAKVAVLGVLAMMVWGYQPAAAGCEVISATHSAESKNEALAMSRALAAESAVEVRRKRGWSYVSMSAYRVKPDPFWKSVRPVVPKDVIYGTFVTAKTYRPASPASWCLTSAPPAPRSAATSLATSGTWFHRLQLLSAARSFPAPRRRSRLKLATTNGKLSVTMFWCDGVEAGFDS